MGGSEKAIAKPSITTTINFITSANFQWSLIYASREELNVFYTNMYRSSADIEYD